MVSYSVLAAAAAIAFMIGVLSGRRRSNTKVIWESKDAVEALQRTLPESRP